jgi:hypothetical protein
MKIPDWLTLRDGTLRQGLNDITWLVMLNGEPQYKLIAVPASGKSTCVITQTNNGKRVDNGIVYLSLMDALNGGLNELQKKLGW